MTNKSLFQDWHVRSADAKDLSAIVELLTCCQLPVEDLNIELMPSFLLGNRDKNSIKNGDQGVDTKQNKSSIVAVVAVIPYGSSGLLRSLAVKSSYRGCGLANLMMDAALNRAAEMSIRNLYLLTETAAEFFRRRGFQVIRRNTAPIDIQSTQEFSSLCPQSAICMVRSH